MKKLLEEHRKLYGNFEVIDFVDEKQITGLRSKLNTDVPLDINWTWEYGSEVAELRALYEKGQVNQWNAESDIDWDLPVSKDEWVLNPQASLLGQACALSGKDEATQ